MNATCMAMLAAAAMAPGLAKADDIFVTQPPGGPFGFTGYFVAEDQTIAERFVPGGEYTLDSITLWFLSMDSAGTTPQTVHITLQTDIDPDGQFTSAPSGVVLESWTIDTGAVGLFPVEVPLNSLTHAPLHVGQRYWVVAESMVPQTTCPVWAWATDGHEFIGIKLDDAAWGTWVGEAVCMRVTGTPLCSADFNCDGDTGTDADIEAFFACLGGLCPPAPCASSADFDGDGDTGTDADIEAFFRVLGGGAC